MQCGAASLDLQEKSPTLKIVKHLAKLAVSEVCSYVNYSHTNFGLRGVAADQLLCRFVPTEQTAIEAKLRWYMSPARGEKSLVRVVFGGSSSDSDRKSSTFTFHR